MIALLAAAWAFDPVIEELPDGRIDWTAFSLLASSVGEPSSGVMVNLETLEGNARSHLGPSMLSMARRVRITSETTAGDLLDAHDAVADRLDDNLSLWEVYEVRYLMSGGVEMDGALPLQSWLRPQLTNAARGKDRTATAVAAVTGLVVDARGLDVHPAVAPRLYDAAGVVVYELSTPSVMAATQRAPVVYVTDPADVAAARRAGAAPIFVRATAVQDGCDLVLDAGDAERVARAAAEAPFLVQANVVIVVRP